MDERDASTCGPGLFVGTVTANVKWTPEMDRIIQKMRSGGKTWPQIANQMGLSLNQVYDRARKGMPQDMRVRSPKAVTPDEIEKIRSWANSASSLQIANYLGCSQARVKMICHRNKILLGRRSKSASDLSGGILLAKTCNTCGLLLGEIAFTRNPNGSYHAECRVCNGKPGLKSEDHAIRSNESNNAWYETVQSITSSCASNHGKEWTSEDLDEISDTQKGAFQLALELGRTYASITNKRKRIGLNVPREPIDLSSMAWTIVFPKAQEMLREYYRKIAIPESEWEWND